MKRNQWAAVLMAVLLFCCGAAVGALGERYYHDRGVVNADQRQHYISDMRSHLKLTPAQVMQLEALLDETKSQYKAARDSCRPAMLKIRSEHIARVKSILTPEQIPVYERLVAEREQHAKEQEERERNEDQKRAAARQQSGH